MATDANADLAHFADFVRARLASGENALSPEQALAQWRERQETIAAVRRGLDDVEHGRTRPADEVLEHLRDELTGS